MSSIHQVVIKVNHEQDGGYSLEYPQDRQEEHKINDLLFEKNAPYRVNHPNSPELNFQESTKNLLAPFETLKESGLLCLYHGLGDELNAEDIDIKSWVEDFQRWYLPPNNLLSDVQLPSLVIDGVTVDWNAHPFNTAKGSAKEPWKSAADRVIEIELDNGEKALMRGVHGWMEDRVPAETKWLHSGTFLN